MRFILRWILITTIMLFYHFLILFLSYLCTINCLNVAYLDKVSSSNDFNALKKYIDKINLSLNNKIEISYHQFIDPIEDSFKSALKTLDPSFIMMNCNNMNDDDLNDYLDEENYFVWCIDAYASGSCKKNRIQGVSVIPSLEQSIIF